MRSIDLFAGIGGMRLGAEANGFTNVFSSEINKHAVEIYKANFGEAPAGDITQIDARTVPDHELLLAGFPCQPFSNSGMRLGFEDTRGTLFFDVARIIEEKSPRAVLLENVKGLIGHDRGNTIRVILRTLGALGYSTSHTVLNAWDFGLPQNRERTIIVAIRGSNRRVDLTAPLPSFRPRLRDFVDAAVPSEYIAPEEYTLIPIELRVEQRSGLIFAGYRNKTLRKNGARPNTEHLSRVHRQPNRIYLVDGVAPTIASQESNGRYFILDDFGVRKLSVRELYRIMGFPESFKLVGTESSLRVAVGNSVAIPSITEVIRRIKLELSGDPLEISKEWLRSG